MKYRKKPIEVEAFQWFPEMGETGGVKRNYAREGLRARGTEIKPIYGIETLEGVMDVKRGDWIITGVRGEKYPCDLGIFNETYEPVGPQS